VTRSPAARVAAYQPRTRTPDRAARAKPARNNMLAKFTREARERLGPDATERQVARAAESARKAFYKRLSAAGVAARKAALHEALVRQRRSALAFAITRPAPAIMPPEQAREKSRRRR
jgi:hypothetical protein